MRRIVIFLLILMSVNAHAQQLTIDTLKNAIANVNTYYPLPFYGTTSSGGIYGAGLNINTNSGGKPLPVRFVRIDFSKKLVTYKFLSGVLSGNGAFWMATFDSAGRAYISINAPVRKVLRFNLKDSIQFEDLGNPFQDSVSWAYSMSLGRDGKMYFGGSGKSTYWSSLDLKTNKFEKHPPIDPADEYVLSIAGDSNYVYAQTGQKHAVNLWSVRKKDNDKKLLGTIPNTSRVQLETHDDGIYAISNAGNLMGLFKLVNGDTVRINKTPLSKQILYAEVNNAKLPAVNAVFDPVKDLLFYTLDNKTFDSITISSTSNRVDIKRIFSFPGDAANLYFVGDFYGNFYRYNFKKGTADLLGSTGYNLYSTLALNDSIMFLGGYPNGFLMKWNRYQPWTTKKFVAGKLVVATDANANPRIVGFWKSQSKPPAGFHHTAQLILDSYNNIVGAGNVIRMGDAASIGAYNIAKDSMYGIAYDAYTGMAFSSIAKWDKLIIYAMSDKYGKRPKLYFYNSLVNKMADSLDLGYDDYGLIHVEGNTLYGIANDQAYSVDLSSKKIIDSKAYPKKTIAASYFLSNHKLLFKAAGNTAVSILPSYNLPYFFYEEANGYVYAIDGNKIVRLSGLVK